MTLARPGSIALFDESLREVDRVAALSGATAVASDAHGTVWVGAREFSDVIALRAVGGHLERANALDHRGFASMGIRELAESGGCLYGIDEHASELVWSSPDGGGRLPLASRPTGLAASSHFVVVTSAVGHRITAFPVAACAPSDQGRFTVENDGPFFGADILERADGSLVIASGGLEDHPLDRRGGSFGYIDSYVYVDSVERGRVRRLAAVDVGELGVITPKALALREEGGALRVDVTGYGSAAFASLLVAADGAVSSRIEPGGVPGSSDLAIDSRGALVVVSPLLDAVVRLGPRANPSYVRETGSAAADPRLPPRDLLRLGEALFYTNAMGPFQQSQGELSRFTCESCHFEGGVDGRTHHTGRGDVVATTKPLFGLGNNRPHFTRALDADLTAMVFAEFRVAAANTGHSEWFTLKESGLDWVSELGPPGDPDAAELRRALVLYLATLPHPPNPRAVGRTELSALERRGASLFLSACEGCHEARLDTSDPASRVPFDEWEALVLASSAPIVWARDGYEKTGVEPYVHPEGARPSSLRRIGDKVPYFTNGSAKSLADVVMGARVTDDDDFLHADPGGAAHPLFDASEARALVAFLSLL